MREKYVKGENFWNISMALQPPKDKTKKNDILVENREKRRSGKSVYYDIYFFK